MGFKRFMALWFTVIIGFLTIALVASGFRENVGEEVTAQPHFSVVWKGFKPSYNNQTPDYYVCISNLKDSILNMSIAFKIESFENKSFWFMIDQYQTPPAGWSVAPYYIGKIDPDTTMSFVYSNLARAKPSSIPEGRITETLALVVKAYYNATYTNLYSQADFTVRYHFIDIESTAWTILYHDNFDDGTTQGWAQGGGGLEWYNHYRSWPCSLNTGYGASKTFNTNGPFTEAYFVCPCWVGGGSEFWLAFNQQRQFQSEVTTPRDGWYSLAVPLPVGSNTQVQTQGWVIIDDIYVVAK